MVVHGEDKSPGGLCEKIIRTLTEVVANDRLSGNDMRPCVIVESDASEVLFEPVSQAVCQRVGKVSEIK